ncbi:MAG: hypothetical protein MR430_07610 [Lachnospiraceae bacterium]|nr:hypothetical protein [Lachnospiraceae bacterium]
MGIQYAAVQFDNLITDLSNCCPGPSACGTCDKSSCIIGYAQNCLVDCMKKGISDVEEGNANIPVMDFKVYEQEEFERGIAHILKMCQACREKECSQCLLSVIRNCYEVGLFGETQPYEGSNLYYFNHIHSHHPQIATDINLKFRAAGEKD